MKNERELALREMGIDPGALPAPSEYEWPVPEAGEAQGVMARLTLSAVLLGNVVTNQAQIDEFHQIGVTTEAVDRAPWIVKLYSLARNAALEVHAAHESYDTLRTKVGPELATWVDLKAAGPVIVASAFGNVCAVADDSGLRVWRLHGLAISPAAQVQAPVLEWMRQWGFADAWLRLEIERKLEAGGPWANVTAAALFARYVTPTEGAESSEWLEAQLTGRIIPALSVPRQWVRQLHATQRRTVLELAAAEVDRLEFALEDVADTATPEAGEWQRQWLEVCHGRDDLEGVLVFVREMSAEALLERRLGHLDRTCRVVRAVLPGAFVPMDERTRRASQLTPGAWWGSE